jgi:hypothetical protein
MISYKEAKKEFTKIMTQVDIDEHERRQKLIHFAKSIGACTRHPEHDGVTGSQAEIIQHILTRFQIMSLADTHIQNSRMWIVALASAIAAVFSAIASWAAVLEVK